MRTIDEDWAAFWCGVLYPLMNEDLSARERSRRLLELATQEHRTPAGKLRKYSVATLRRKFRKYKNERLKGFLRKRRADLGKSRILNDATLEQLIQLKKDLPSRAADTLSRMLFTRSGMTASRSTLYRHLKAAGATRQKLGITQMPVRRRWTREHTHDLWVGDFQEGPFVLHQNDSVQTQLSVFIDCHSRFIVAGRYYLHQRQAALEDTLLRAFVVHGSPLEILFDNAKVYHSKAYMLMCGAMGIKRLYRKPYEPEAGGLVERFFRTSQEQFETEVRAGRQLTLDELNQAFMAWLEMVYHVRVHSELDQTPQERYKKGLGVIRNVDPASIHEFFMRREMRTVNRIYSDVSLDNRLYRVDHQLRGDRVEVRFDPFSDGSRVVICTPEGVFLCEGRLHNRELGEAMPPHEAAKAKSSFLADLMAEHQRQLAGRFKELDWKNLRPDPERWPFSQFACLLASELGRQGGLSAFNAGELETIKKFWTPKTGLLPEIVKEAARQAHPKTLSQILLQIKTIFS